MRVTESLVRYVKHTSRYVYVLLQNIIIYDYTVYFLNNAYDIHRARSERGMRRVRETALHKQDSRVYTNICSIIIRGG